MGYGSITVVYQRSKIQILKQITTLQEQVQIVLLLFISVQRYKF